MLALDEVPGAFYPEADDGQPRTLEEVGRFFGVTRERVRQIESKTLAKLRHPLRSDKLKDYLNDA